MWEETMVGTSAVEEIRETLRREIVDLYQVGDVLPCERDLAERFDVSRNTIRETMIHLEAFQLVRKTKRGAQVSKPDFDTMFRGFTQFFGTSTQTFTDVLNFRRIVETGAGPLITHNATDDCIARMADANRRMQQALTTSEAAEWDYRFHLALVDASRNDVLSRMYRVMSVPLRYYLEVGKSHTPATTTAHEQHAQIIDALHRRDSEALTRTLSAHFQHSSDTLTEWLATREGNTGPVSVWPP
ncbi:MAG: FadR/GntR family transcriptional regulator [Paracoccaceae bacterium]